ncbi:MAG: nucleoside deaminase [Synergistaceae bacterium]|nr:nucleoside deaminase [Synergistota bacterium]NLM72088.1 nucleoside deaminase [Synergistaceae bacterium]
MLDVIEEDIVPLTARGVSIGCKVFGAAVLRKDDLSLVVAGTNHEAFSPLWHGEIYTIKLFYELQGHPDPSECLFLSTHEPCSMCISALAWAGFGEIYYFFGYEQTQDDFNIPHDLRMLREVFGCATPSRDNIYFKSRSLLELAEGLEDREAARSRIERIKNTYADLSAVYQAGEKKMVLK